MLEHVTIQDKQHPVFFGGAAIRHLWEALKSETLGEVTAKLVKQKEDNPPPVTDKELFDVFIPLVKWGIWGGYRHHDKQEQLLDDDYLADALWDGQMTVGYQVLECFLNSLPKPEEGEKPESGKK